MAQEKRYENKVKSYLDSIGAYYIKTHGDKFTRVGTPDIIATINGHFVALEVKATNGKPSELQLYHLRNIMFTGAYSAIIAPTDGVEKIRKYIDTNFEGYEDVRVVDLEKFKKDVENALTSHYR